MSTILEQDRAVRAVRAGVAAHRLSVVWLAAISMAVGLTMILTGAPAFVEDWFSPWSRVVLGALAFAPAVCTVVGALLSHNTLPGWWMQVAGLFGQATWYGAMMVVYCGLLVDEGAQWANLGEALDPAVSGRGYVPIIYLGLLGLAVIPLVTLLRLGRPGR